MPPPSAASAACAASTADRSCGAFAQRSGIGAARGIEITVTIDEKAFEGTGAFLLGAVLDRFFAEYSGFNHFTQTVIRSVERGESCAGRPAWERAGRYERRTIAGREFAAQPRGRALAVRLFRRAAAPRTHVQGSAADRRQRRAPRRVRHARAGSVHGFPGVEPRPRRPARQQDAKDYSSNISACSARKGRCRSR